MAAMPRSASILSSRVAAIAIGPHQSLMDAHGERHGEEAGGGLNEQASPPAARKVPRDEFGLGICFGLLMQELDRRHLAAALGDLDAVADQDTLLPLARSGWGNSRSTSWVHSAVSRSSFTAELWKHR